jgi:hypothetical protein
LEADKLDKAQGIHSSGLDRLIKRLHDSEVYSQIYKELEYYNPYTREHGEIDVLAQHKNGSWFIFEYKCNNAYKARSKAEKQLYRAEVYISCEEHAARIYKFYVSGRNNKVLMVK